MSLEEEYKKFIQFLVESLPEDKRARFIEEVNKISSKYDDLYKKEFSEEEANKFFSNFLMEILEVYTKI